ncbi:MAG TPA: hypothetical protein VGJ21_11175 [Terracidiphilus sp.]
MSPEIQAGCVQAARRALGPHAVVVKCGDLNTPGVLEVVGVIPAKFPASHSGIAIRGMAILRREPSGWRTELTAVREIKNEAGYIGIDYIDDSSPFFGYWLVLSDTRSDGKKSCDLDLLDIEERDGSSEAASTEIAWNPAAFRYQEFTTNRDPEGFRAEIKSPAHRKPGMKLPTSR